MRPAISTSENFELINEYNTVGLGQVEWEGDERPVARIDPEFLRDVADFAEREGWLYLYLYQMTEDDWDMAFLGFAEEPGSESAIILAGAKPETMHGVEFGVVDDA